MKTQCVAYFRVSTVRQGESGLGLDAQRDVVRRFATAHKMAIVAEHTEVESGKVNTRPQLAAALALCRKINATLADVVAAMGHGGSPTMIFSHYRNVVSEEDGKKWFTEYHRSQFRVDT